MSIKAITIPAKPYITPDGPYDIILGSKDISIKFAIIPANNIVITEKILLFLFILLGKLMFDSIKITA